VTPPLKTIVPRHLILPLAWFSLAACSLIAHYDRGRALNKLTVAQWDILRDPNGNLVGGFSGCGKQ